MFSVMHANSAERMECRSSTLSPRGKLYLKSDSEGKQHTYKSKKKSVDIFFHFLFAQILQHKHITQCDICYSL